MVSYLSCNSHLKGYLLCNFVTDSPWYALVLPISAHYIPLHIPSLKQLSYCFQLGVYISGSLLNSKFLQCRVNVFLSLYLQCHSTTFNTKWIPLQSWQVRLLHRWCFPNLQLRFGAPYIYSFHKHVLKTYYVPSPVLDTGNTTINKTKCLASWSLRCNSGDKKSTNI